MRTASPDERRGGQGAGPGLARIIGPSLMMTALMALSTGGSFVYQLMVARRFGVGAEMDAYLVATALPSYLMTVLLASFNLAFIPIFVQNLTRGTEGEAWEIASTTLKIVAGVLICLCAGGMILTPQLVGLLAPGFAPHKRDVATYLLRILFPSMVFSGIFSCLSSIHVSLRSFALPSVAPLLYTLVNIAVLWALAPSLGIASVALGTTLGQASQALVLVPKLLRVGRKLGCFDLRHPGVQAMLKLVGPLLIISLVASSNDIVERFFASGLPAGSISYLGYALRLLAPLRGILISGMLTALFPLMAEQAARPEGVLGGELRRTVAQSLNLLLFVTLPVAAWLAMLRRPILTLVLQRGAFDQKATLGTASALLCYLGYFVLSAIDNVPTRAFYVLKDTVTPTKVRVIGLGLYVLLCALLVRQLSYIGLALALSLSALCTTAADIGLVSRRLGTLPWGDMASALTRKVLATGTLGCAAYFVSKALGARGASAAPSMLLLRVLLASAAGAAAFVLAAWGLRCEELVHVQQAVQARLAKRAAQALGRS